MKKLIIILLVVVISCKDENKPPICTITQPENNTSFTLGESILIEIEASDPDGFIHEVQLYFDGHGISLLEDFPYTFTINTDDYGPGEYAIKATAFDEEGLDTSDEITISIDPVLASLTTSTVISVTDTSAISGGNISSNGGAEVSSRGICWSGTSNPTIDDSYSDDGSGLGEFTSTIAGLNPETEYFVRAYAINTAGIAYGNEVSFTTHPVGEKVVDYDGNIYGTIQLGNQLWMAKNLKVTHYADGTIIPNITASSEWSTLSSTDKAWCFNENSIEIGNIYGALYTWAAAMNGEASSNNIPSDVQGVCPDGWHLPSDVEWMQMEIYLGMSQADAETRGFRGTNEASKLAGTDSLWNDGVLVNDSEFGISGFNAIPAGIRGEQGDFGITGRGVNFWTSSETSATDALRRRIDYDNTMISHHYGDKRIGRSVRCIKD